MFCACLASLLLGLQAPPLECRYEARPLRAILEDLGKRSGTSLKVEPGLAGEPLILVAKGATLDDLKARIADAISAEWVATKEGPELRRTPALVANLEAARANERLTSVRQGMQALSGEGDGPLDAKKVARQFEEFFKNLKLAGTTPTTGSQMQALSQATAEARLLRRMLFALGAEALAAAPPGIAVYTVAPTATQRPLPGMDQGDIAAYVREHNALAEALNTLMGGRPAPAVATGLDRAFLTASADGLRPLLKVTNDPAANSLNCDLTVYAGDGSLLGQSTVRLDAVAYPEYLRERLRLARTPERLALTPEVSQVAQRLAQFASPTPPPLQPAARDLLIQPETSDPLCASLADPMIQQAEKEGLNLVAYASDNSYYPCLFHGMKPDAQGAINPNVYLYVLTSQGKEKLERKDGWLVVKPADPLEATETRIDRPAMGRFMRALRQQGYATIEDWTALAGAHDHEAAETMVDIAVAALRANLNGFHSVDWSTCRLYDSFSDTQRERLLAGGSLPAGGLTRDQRAMLAHLVYGSTTAEIVSGGEGVMGTIESEPTEVLPSGLRDDLPVTMADTADETFYVTRSGGGGVVKDMPLKLEWLAQTLAAQELPDRFTQPAPIQAVSYGRTRQVTISVGLTAKLSMRSTIKEEMRPQGEPIPVPLLKDRLPGGVWARLSQQIEDAKARFLKEPKPATPHDPPPPP